LELSGQTDLAGRVDGAYFEHYRMRKRMVYASSRNDWLIVWIAYVYMCIYCASREGVTLTHEEQLLGRWSGPKRNRERLILR
jgi:hypothetical protein